jgi:hypothetical protein
LEIMRDPSPFAAETARPFAAASLVALLAAVGLRVALQHPPYLPSALLLRLPASLDLGVIALFGPLCAIVFALLFEVCRLGLEGKLPDEVPPHARAIAHWQDTDG